MLQFKKIAVCHGKSCEPKGALRIMKILEQKYAQQGVEITETLCCGRCEHSCTIVVDNQHVSDLSVENIKKNFLDNPCQAIADAKKNEAESSAALDRILSDDLPL